jgi:hypothetical protein
MRQRPEGTPMPPTDDLLDWKGRVVVDLHGRRIGRIVDVQFTSETDVPEWGSIRFGRLGLRRRFVPLGDAELLAGQVRVPYTKAMVQGAPAWPQASCRPPRDHALREYYGLGEEPPP